jgi:hypothetical protein
MTQIPTRTTRPFDQHLREAARQLSARPAPSLADGDAQTAAPLPTGLRRTRVCVLCGQPLRAGQPMLRLQGTTIHARCSKAGPPLSAGRGSSARP